jgi:two-component sensor histidine kinase
MAIVHEMLYHSKNLGQIKYADYLRRLVNQLTVSMRGTESKVVLKIEVPEIFLNLDTAIPLGLMINEIITNSLKYAFNGVGNDEIYIRIRENGGNNFTMFIGDNGAGFPENIRFRETGSLGVLLMHNLALQLEGGIEKVNQPGTHYIINFKEISQTS